MIVTSVQIKTVKTQKHLYCPFFTDLCDYKAQKPKTLEKSRALKKSDLQSRSGFFS